MARYAIGDLQGCFKSFQGLLKLISFNPQTDELWLVGDLVNRGPDSLACLRWIKNHQNSVKMVLGNHDLYLLGRYLNGGKDKSGDTIEEILIAPDCADLCNWLITQPVLQKQDGFLMVHGGLLPEWTEDQTTSYATAITKLLQSDAAALVLEKYRTMRHWKWHDNLSEFDRNMLALQIMTTIRVCHTDGTLKPKFKGPPVDLPEQCKPWFELAHQRSSSTRVIFGHWSALGLRQSAGIVGLDSGCVWGRSLTAWNLDSGDIFQQVALEGSQT